MNNSCGMLDTTGRLLEKYDVPGPRYTSYPTILHWDSSPTPSEWIDSVSESLDLGERHAAGAAIYVHIPYCQSLCTYCGCNSRITTKKSVAKPYLLTVLREFELYLESLGRSTSTATTSFLPGSGIVVCA